MSRLSKLVEKPFTKTLQWRNEKFNKKTKTVEQEKGWYYYVPSEMEGEKGSNVMVEMPFSFVWLTDVTSFTGYNELEKASIYSNEVLNDSDLKELFPRATKEQLVMYKTLKAKMGKETLATGLYADIKDAVVSKGGKYCKPVYGLLITDEGTEIVRLLMSGGSIESWIPFSKNKGGLMNNAISCCGSEEREKGSVQYEIPKFKFVPTDKVTINAANEATVKVFEYFKYLLTDLETTEVVEEELVEETIDGDLPF